MVKALNLLKDYYLIRKIGFYHSLHNLKKLNREYYETYEINSHYTDIERSIFVGKKDCFQHYYGFRSNDIFLNINDIRYTFLEFKDWSTRKVYQLPRHYWHSLTKLELDTLYKLDKYGWDKNPRMTKARRAHFNVYEDLARKREKEYEILKIESNHHDSGTWCTLL